LRALAYYSTIVHEMGEDHRFSYAPAIRCGSTSPACEQRGRIEMQDQDEDTRQYTVVMNHEEQYSIWPSGREIPAGWQDGGRSGSKQECLAYIEEVWTDMRPLSLRKKMAEAGS
jgi:MbtH protein